MSLRWASTFLILLFLSDFSQANICSDLVTSPTEKTELIDSLLRKASEPGPGQLQARLQIQKELGLNDINTVYYLSLFQKFLRTLSNGSSELVRLYSNQESRFT